MFGNRSSVWKGGHPFVRRICNSFGTRLSVYLRNYFVDIYGTIFWISKGLFFYRFFVGIAFKGERARFLYQGK